VQILRAQLRSESSARLEEDAMAVYM